MRRLSTTGGAYKFVKTLPPDAIAVVTPDGTVVPNPTSPTGKLMAPPDADFRKVFAAGKIAGGENVATRNAKIIADLTQGGTYDFQRNNATMTGYTKYENVSNYTVGVYLAGAGDSEADAVARAEVFALLFSSHKYNKERIYWIMKGWEDASKGLWGK